MRTTTQATGNRRLLTLAAFLRKLPEERFDYRHWVGADWKGAKDLSCGTSACALGWATAIPEFQRLGLRLKKVRYWGFGVVLGESKSLDSLKAARVIFALDTWEARFLFEPGAFDEDYKKQAPHGDASARKVASHIERFVKRRQKAKAS